MNNNIEVNDLVQVIKGCPGCGGIKNILGRIFVVNSILPHHTGIFVCCLTQHTFTLVGGLPEGYIPIDIVKKIPPIEDLEGAEDSRDLKVPVKGKELEKV